MTVESENAKEEARGIVEKCMKCGLCKGLCPVFKVMKQETYSPRGRVILLENELYDKIFFECCLCGACEKRCPLNIKLCDAFLKARQALSESGKGSKFAKEVLIKFEKEGVCI